MSDSLRTEVELRREGRRAWIIFALMVLAILAGLAAWGYLSLKAILLGNGRIYTSHMYSDYLREYEAKAGEYPTCQTVGEFAWLSVAEAVCREKYLPELAVEACYGFSYEMFLDYKDSIVRVAICRQENGTEGFCLVYFRGISGDEMTALDKAVRARQFRGEESLEGIVQATGCEVRLFHHFSWVDTPDMVARFLEKFAHGQSPPVQ